jgi:hypothetical protein
MFVRSSADFRREFRPLPERLSLEPRPGARFRLDGQNRQAGRFLAEPWVGFKGRRVAALTATNNFGMSG